MYLGLLQWLGDGDYGNGFGMLIAMLIRNEMKMFFVNNNINSYSNSNNLFKFPFI